MGSSKCAGGSLRLSQPNVHPLCLCNSPDISTLLARVRAVGTDRILERRSGTLEPEPHTRDATPIRWLVVPQGINMIVLLVVGGSVLRTVCCPGIPGAVDTVKVGGAELFLSVQLLLDIRVSLDCKTVLPPLRSLFGVVTEVGLGSGVGFGFGGGLWLGCRRSDLDRGCRCGLGWGLGLGLSLLLRCHGGDVMRVM